MTITHKINIDLTGQKCPVRIDAVQGDCGRELAIALHVNGLPWSIPATTNVAIRYRRADGTGGEYDTLPDGNPAWNIGQNILTVAIAPQVLTAAGEACLSLLLEDGKNAISTFDILLNVHPGILNRISSAGANMTFSATTVESALLDIGARITCGRISSIVLLGDSVTDGMGGSGYNGSRTAAASTNTDGYCWANVFKKFIEERYGVPVTNKGMCGTDMAAQREAVLADLKKEDFVIWMVGAGDRDDPDALKVNMRGYLKDIKDRCAGLLVISGIPTTENDENSHSCTMQTMDDIVTRAAIGYVPYFSMYQEFCRYCSLHSISLPYCYADHMHPNDQGYYIMFWLLCRKLGLPLDAYTDYQRNAVWWDPFVNDEVLATNLSMHQMSAFTSGLGSSASVVPCAYMNGYDAATATTALSGKYISRITIHVDTAGVITFGTADLNTVGQQKPVCINQRSIVVPETGLVTLDLHLKVGEHETLIVQQPTDTGKLGYFVGAVSQQDPLRFWTSGSFQNNVSHCFVLYGAIYGHN